MGSNIAVFDAVRSVANGSITTSYTALGSAFGHPMRILHFINDTDGDMMISFDGTTDNIPVLADSFSLYDVTSDEDSNEAFRFQQGTQVYIRYLSAPTTGTFYLAAMYGKGE
jgi:hypothetical protein